MTANGLPSPLPHRGARAEVHQLAAFVHGALAALHLLGVVYNLRRHNPAQTLAHVAGVAFSVHATQHHRQCGS